MTHCSPLTKAWSPSSSCSTIQHHLTLLTIALLSTFSSTSLASYRHLYNGPATTFLAGHYQSHSTFRPRKTSTLTQAYLKVPPRDHSCTLPMRRNCRRSLKDIRVVFHSFADNTWLSKVTFKQQSRQLSTVSRAYKTGGVHTI